MFRQRIYSLIAGHVVELLPKPNSTRKVRITVIRDQSGKRREFYLSLSNSFSNRNLFLLVARKILLMA